MPGVPFFVCRYVAACERTEVAYRIERGGPGGGGGGVILCNFEDFHLKGLTILASLTNTVEWGERMAGMGAMHMCMVPACTYLLSNLTVCHCISRKASVLERSLDR